MAYIDYSEFKRELYNETIEELLKYYLSEALDEAFDKVFNKVMVEVDELSERQSEILEEETPDNVYELLKEKLERLKW